MTTYAYVKTVGMNMAVIQQDTMNNHLTILIIAILTYVALIYFQI